MNEGNIISRVFIFAFAMLTCKIRENKNPAKISTYTVIPRTITWTNDGIENDEY